MLSELKALDVLIQKSKDMGDHLCDEASTLTDQTPEWYSVMQEWADVIKTGVQHMHDRRVIVNSLIDYLKSEGELD